MTTTDQPQSPLAVLARGGFDALAQAAERHSQRKCATCGKTFDAVGFTAYCDPCGLAVDKRVANATPSKLDSSWPKLHAEKLNSLTGPALAMAEKLAPKMFGNRLLVLAGDRGRGKTQIATFIAHHRLTNGRDCGIYSRAYDMVRMCEGYDADSRRAILAFQKVPFLAVDECHRIDPKKIHIVESILDARYANNRTTMLIGNWMTPEGMEHGEVVSEQQLHGLGPTLMDRVNEHTHNRTGGVVWCRWESYRK